MSFSVRSWRFESATGYIGGVMKVLQELNEHIEELQSRHEKMMRGKTQHNIHTEELLEESRIIRKMNRDLDKLFESIKGVMI